MQYLLTFFFTLTFLHSAVAQHRAGSFDLNFEYEDTVEQSRPAILTYTLRNLGSAAVEIEGLNNKWTWQPPAGWELRFPVQLFVAAGLRYKHQLAPGEIITGELDLHYLFIEQVTGPVEIPFTLKIVGQSHRQEFETILSGQIRFFLNPRSPVVLKNWLNECETLLFTGGETAAHHIAKYLPWLYDNDSSLLPLLTKVLDYNLDEYYGYHCMKRLTEMCLDFNKPELLIQEIIDSKGECPQAALSLLRYRQFQFTEDDIKRLLASPNIWVRVFLLKHYDFPGKKQASDLLKEEIRQLSESIE